MFSASCMICFSPGLRSQKVIGKHRNGGFGNVFREIMDHVTQTLAMLSTIILERHEKGR